MQKILLVGGGTGGHIFPLYNLCEALINQGIETHLLVNDSELDKKIVQQTFTKLSSPHPKKASSPRRQGPTFHYLKAHKIHYHLAFSNLVNWFKIIGSCWSARKLLKELKPDAIFFKGGFVGFPVLIAAKWLAGFKGKIYLHESDVSSGALSKLFGKHADQTFSNFGDNPHPLFYWPPERGEGPSADQRKTILIFGGSQGAQFINDLIINHVDKLCEKYRVVLVAGPDKIPTRHPGLDPGPSNLEIHEFMDQDKLIEQINCSSLVIARAGASVFQVLAAQKPLIAIPLPTAARNHQLHNAQYFAQKGLCYLLEQNKNTQAQLLPTIEKILTDQRLKKKLSQFKVVPKAEAIAQAITG